MTKQAAAPTTAPAQQTTRSFLALFSFLFALFACLAAFYALFLVENNQQRFEKAMHTQLDLQAELATLNEAHASDQTELANLTHHFHQTIDQHKGNLWAVEQAQSFLEAANIEAQLRSNVVAYKLLLDQAKKILLSTQQSAFDSTINAITQIELQLQQMPVPDVTQLLNQFHQFKQALHQAIPPLPVDNPNSAAPATPLQHSLKKLKNIISIQYQRPHDLPSASLRQAMLLNRIDLSLQEAELAILQNNARLYQFSIKQITEAISVLFETQPQLKRSFLDRLQKLTTTSIFTAMPSVNLPLQRLNEWRKKDNMMPSVPITNQPAS